MLGMMTTRKHKRLMREAEVEYNHRVAQLALSQDRVIDEIRRQYQHRLVNARRPRL